MYSIERKAEILKLLEQNGRVDVNELSSLLQASRETIRRDLSELEENGALKRTHGGAVFGSINPKTVDEFPVAVREIQQFKEKDAICQRAAAFIEDGDSLFVDNSSTCIYLLKYIPPEYHVTIITNSIKVMLEAAKNRHANHMLVCLGGLLNESNLSLYGNTTLKNGGEYYPNKAFMSCAEIRFPDEVLDSSLLEVDTKRLMIERAQQTCILAYYTKFKKAGHVFLCNFASIHTLITDSKTQAEHIEYLVKAGIRVVVAD